jgi:hypothetical protein
MAELPSSDPPPFNSDPRDEDYRPDVEQRLASVEQFFTGTSRRLTSSTTHSQKRKAKELDPRDGRCMLSNEREPSCSVEVCHLLARATKPGILTALEYFWGMQYWSLDVDSSKNLCFQMRTLHTAFDNHYWFLVPSLDIMIKLAEFKREPNIPITSVYGTTEVFTYTIVPLEIMQEVVIHYRSYEPDVRLDSGRPHLTPHYWPYNTLPTLESHIQPHFVVCNAGEKLARIIGSVGFLDKVASVFESKDQGAQTLLQCSSLYSAWYHGEDIPSSFRGVHSPSSQRSGNLDEGGLRDNLLSDTGYQSTRSGHRTKSTRGNATCTPDAPQDQLICQVHDGPEMDVIPEAEKTFPSWDIKKWVMLNAVVPNDWKPDVFNDGQIGFHADDNLHSNDMVL